MVWEGINQRRFPRAKYECKVTLNQQGGGVPISAVTENIGLGGVCVLLEKGFDVFSPAELELALKDGLPPLKVQGTVVWVVRRRGVKQGPSYDTGVEFVQLLPEDKSRLEALLSKLGTKE